MKVITLSQYLSANSGKFKIDMAKELGVSRNTLREWCEYPDKVLLHKQPNGKWNCYPIHDYGNKKRQK